MLTRVLSFISLVAVVWLVGVFAVSAQGPQPQSPQSPLGQGFTYQGQLKKSGAPVYATCSMTFSLWDAPGSGSPPTGGTQIGTNQPLASVPVSNGLFTVLLNSGNQFGASAFNGQERWLQAAVLCPGDSSTATLSRQPLTAAPYALFATAPWVTSGSNLYYNSGRVGIGTAAPTYRLHVLDVGNAGLRVQTNAVGGAVASFGGYGSFQIDAPGVQAGRFVVTQEGNVGIGRSSPDAGLHVSVSTSNSGNNTAQFDATSIGPNASHIHYGTTGDWYIRSAASGGTVVIQDSGGNVGIGTANASDKLTVAGTINSTSGGYKFPDGSVQSTAAPNLAYTTYSAPALDTREIADVNDAGPTTLAQFNLPAGTYQLMATADFANGAAMAFQDNSRLVRCTFYDQEFRFHIQPGGGGFFGRFSTSWHIVKILNAQATVSLACQAYTGGTDHSYVYGNATRITAIKLASITVQ